MGLRCLMGHDFGEVQTQRDRRERGDEVVVTVREYRECSRCGETRTVSENKEVRSAGPAGGPDEGAADEGAHEDPVYDDVSAEEDDGVILDDEPGDREPGAWPEADESAEAPTADAEPEPWPEVEGDDEGYSAEPSDGRPVEGVQFGTGLSPEASGEDAGASASEGEVIESAPAGEAFRPSATTGVGGAGQRVVAADTELVCPECEFTAPVRNASLRPGDICPECRLGYLTERET